MDLRSAQRRADSPRGDRSRPRGRRSGARRLDPRGVVRAKRSVRRGEIHHLDASERFESQFRREGPTGLQVGFAFYPAQAPELAGVEAEPTFEVVGRTDDRLAAWARWLALDAPEITTSIAETSRREILDYVRRVASWREPDSLVRVKRDIEGNFASQLYVRHWAELAGMHAETLARAFRRRFGITPVAYRTQCRLAAASTLAWSRPDWSFAQIAAECGFSDESYFHRAFRRQFGVTPAQWGRRDRPHVS